MTCIFIFTRDFRNQDNLTLSKLVSKNYKNIIPIFIFTPQQASDDNIYKSDNSLQCLCLGLKDLNMYLENTLNIFYGNTIDILDLIYQQYPDIEIVASNSDTTPFGLKRNKDIKKWTKKNDIKCLKYCDYTLVPLDLIKTQNGTYYKTFKHFYTQVKELSSDIINVISYKYDIDWKSIQLDQISNKDKLLLNTQIGIDDIDVFYDYNPNNVFLPFTRIKIVSKLKKKSLEKFKNYTEMRKYSKYYTTLFSAYLKYGLVSFREVYRAVYNEFGEDSELLKQLIWRQYYYYLMYHLPENQTIGDSNFQMKEIDWTNNQNYLEAWKQGMTGFPFIDASMRQLNTEGWLPNSSRLCVANALVYLFHCDWRLGELYFAQQLSDYDISQNNGNWQWCGGVGIDRKPYLRMYNPFDMVKKHDPTLEYTKKWLPELKHIPNQQLKNWETHYNKYIDLNYPSPILDYSSTREISKEMFL